MTLETEQYYMDFDWFFTDTKNIGSVASAGAQLPKSVLRSKENLELLTSFFEELPPITEAIINPRLQEFKLGVKLHEIDLSNFIFMAERGLYSFDKALAGNLGDNRYCLVASPAVALTIQDLPPEISDIILETIIPIGINEPIDISSFL